MKCTQFIGVILIWVSKFLWFTECATCNIRSDDPELNGLWYLRNNRRNEYDMNLLPAWRICVNGTGVTVGVVDKGVQDHKDLNINRNLDVGKTQSEEYWRAESRLDERRSRYNTWNRQRQQSSRPGYNSQYRQPQQSRRPGYNSQYRQHQQSRRPGYNSQYRQHQQRRRPGYNSQYRQHQQSRRPGYNSQYRQPRYSIQHRQQESLKHGTRVAGIVAAKKNGQGIVGIAFGAEIADITIASSAVFESFNASALRHRCDVVDVYSCSFANFHTGTKTYPLLPNQESALEYGTTNGRRNLGSVYVFATGNSGGEENDVFRDSCSYDRLVTNRYVISVAGIQHNLQKLPNGEACSAMMVAAFTAKAGSRSNKVVTTDIGNSTTRDFNQNSAAAPMVSGAVALALSANPALTYRDIMHLLVQTSRSDLKGQAYQSKFFTNAANIKVSSYFGFGLLDIGNLVERSKTWKNVPRKESCRTITTYNKRLNRDSIVVQVTQCSVSYIEHVEVSLKVNHQHAGQIKWVLVSPHGTKSTILPGRGLDPTTEMDITVLTVQLWGENPIGYWTLEPTAVFGKSLGYGTVESASLLIHGYACRSSVECLPPAEQDRPSPTVRSLPEQVDRTQDVGSSLMTGRRSGECPSHLTPSCVEQCSSDSDCLYYQTCCHNGCGHTCEISRTQQGFWTNWNQWSRCSVTCGRGYRSRRRRCHSGHCSGERSETRRCNNQECQTQVQYNGRRSGVCPPQNELTTRCMEQCSNDSECSVNQKCCLNGCGKTCEMSRTYQGSLTNWNQWSRCSVTCGQGTQSRRRQCHSGHCSGERSERRQCNNQECQTEVQYNECSDSYDGCRRLARINYCTLRPRYMHLYCRRTCDLC